MHKLASQNPSTCSKHSHWAIFIARHFGLMLLLSLFCSLLSAQTAEPPLQDSTQKLKIETAQVVEYFIIGERTLQKLSGDVRLRQENTLVYCDTAILEGDDAILRGKVTMEQGDTVNVFADSAHYRADTKISDLFGNVVLVNGQQQVFTERLRYNLGTKVATYHTGGTLSNGKSQLTSTHGYYYVNEKMAHFKDKVVVTDPDFTMRTDTMVFNTGEQMVFFVAPTLISQQKGKIYTEGGFYDIENKFAEFDKNPQYERDGERGRAQKMRYNGISKDYVLEGDAIVEEPKKGQEAKADVIRYNPDTKQSVLIGNATYKDENRNIAGAEIHYDSKNKSYQLAGRGKVADGDNIIEADSLDFNDELGNGMAQGNVIWKDTASDYTILSYRMDYNKKTEYLSAYGGFGQGAGGRPMMKTLVDKDTLYMAADTLTSWRRDTLSDYRLLSAHRDVRIFKSDLQGLCDSMSFSSVDSIFRFYKIKNQPVLWSDTSQFSADTIWMWMKNQQLNRIWLRANTLVINSEDGAMFNQIKGRHNTVFFRENEVRQMLVEGNAQAIYYALDDSKAYVGVNETECSEMRLFFDQNQVEGIKFYTEPKGKFSPMDKNGSESKKLEGFFWEMDRRPRSVGDLLVRREAQ